MQSDNVTKFAQNRRAENTLSNAEIPFQFAKKSVVINMHEGETVFSYIQKSTEHKRMYHLHERNLHEFATDNDNKTLFGDSHLIME